MVFSGDIVVLVACYFASGSAFILNQNRVIFPNLSGCFFSLNKKHCTVLY